MKNLLFTAVALFTFCQVSSAQSNWSIGKFGFGIAPSAETYRVSSFDQVLNLAKNKEEVIRDLSSFEGNVVAYVDGGYAGFQFLLTPPKANRALLIAPSISLGKEMFVSQSLYDENATTVNWDPNRDFQNGLFDEYPKFEEAAYCIVENELRLDVAWLHTKKWRKRSTLYGGFGGSVSGTFNNDFIVMGVEKIEVPGEEEPQFRDLEGTYESKNTLTSRAFAYGGVSYRFSRHLELAVDTKLGVGVQKALGGGPTHFLNKSLALGINLRYIL